MMLTNDDRVAERLRLLRLHGMKPRYIHREVGINSRLDGIQAAVLNVKLNRLAEWTEARRSERAALYARCSRRSTWTITSHCRRPCPDADHVWNQFTIRVQHGLRDALRQYLRQHGVGSEIYYPIPLHQQACFKSLGYKTAACPSPNRRPVKC